MSIGQREDLIIEKRYAEIKQLKDVKEHNRNVVRVYRSFYPDGYTFQIRTFKGIGEFGEGKKRDMIATVKLTIKEVEDILDYMKSAPDA